LETRNQLANMQKEVSNTARAAKSAESSTSSFEVRLNRALEDVDRLKAELASSRTAATEMDKTNKESSASMQSQLKRLEKQRGDLVAAFKKQMRLIDILKRQRIHVCIGFRVTRAFAAVSAMVYVPLLMQMEAARLLAFTEDDFSKLMDSAPA
jgi:septal ring factor EnvC (AmiA/AmiB activator)